MFQKQILMSLRRTTALQSQNDTVMVLEVLLEFAFKSIFTPMRSISRHSGLMHILFILDLFQECKSILKKGTFFFFMLEIQCSIIFNASVDFNRVCNLILKEAGCCLCRHSDCTTNTHLLYSPTVLTYLPSRINIHETSIVEIAVFLQKVQTIHQHTCDRAHNTHTHQRHKLHSDVCYGYQVA